MKTPNEAIPLINLESIITREQHDELLKTFNRNSISALQKEVHALAREKGWYDSNEGRNPLEMLALIMSEVGEAVEEVRKGNEPVYGHAHNQIDGNYKISSTDSRFTKYTKPEGEFVELADAIIRILDYAEFRGVNMQEVIKMKHEYNKTRSYRHGNKKY